MKLAVGIALAAVFAWIAFRVLHFVVRLRFPPKIPPDSTYEHAIESALPTREIAEILAKKFPSPMNGVVCLGVVRGTAARILFHSGPLEQKKNRNIHRHDYVLEVVRRNKTPLLRLALNRPYSYLRIRRSELAPLVAALHEVYDDITNV